MNSLKTLDGILLRRLELCLCGAETKEETVELLKKAVKHFACGFLLYAEDNPELLEELWSEKLFDKFIEDGGINKD